MNGIVSTQFSRGSVKPLPSGDESPGWMCWPDNEDYSIEFMRALGSAEEGGSTVFECFLTASRITAGGDESWYREWKAVADISKERGDHALAAGNIFSACSHWLRASNYYRTSEVFLKVDDRRSADALEKMRTCSNLFVAHQSSKSERVRIPCFEDSFVEAYFLRAPGPAQQAPVVVCIGGQGHFKDSHLLSLMRLARARRLSLLLVELPGQGASPRNKVSVRFEVETAISCCVDYLIARDDVDERRIAIFGDGSGAAFASRAASLDDRFAASVSDAGIGEIVDRVSTMMSVSGEHTKDLTEAIGTEIRRMRRHGGLTEIRCPTLVIARERDWPGIGHIRGMCSVLKTSGADLTLRIASPAETVPFSTQADNEFILDWIARRLDAVQEAEKP